LLPFLTQTFNLDLSLKETVVRFVSHTPLDLVRRSYPPITNI
jgi:hypothetical protein